jgi:2-amino-4-hydroxy-6-hydroxymethyldihydropteridine diphosphokinase
VASLKHDSVLTTKNDEPVSLLHTAYISVGSNLSHKLENCRNGIAALTRLSGIRLVERSRIYRTEPVDYLDQDWFVNYVVKIETDLRPLVLLTHIKTIEQAAGRKQGSIRFGPRVLDLDILLFDDVVQEDSRLTIPHPRMHKRRFVLKPICDIDPGIIHPVLRRPMQALLDELPDREQGIMEYT